MFRLSLRMLPLQCVPDMPIAKSVLLCSCLSPVLMIMVIRNKSHVLRCFWEEGRGGDFLRVESGGGEVRGVTEDLAFVAR